jgi:hypothetical protein
VDDVRELLEDIQRASSTEARAEHDWKDGADYRNGPVVRVTTQYDRLEPCLFTIRAALERQQVTYVVQPVGSGRFTIEATLPQASVDAVLAGLRLREQQGQRFAKLGEAVKDRPETETVQQPATKPAVSAELTPAEPGRRVHLILHFERGAPADASVEP